VTVPHPRLPRSRWIIAVTALLAAAGTARLGVWQLDRAHNKISIANTINQRSKLPPITAGQLVGSAQAGASSASADALLQSQLARRIQLSGRWLTPHSVVLDNRQMDGRPGFYLLTPLRLADGRVVMVQRGWWPRDARDRSRVPMPPEVQGIVSLTGRIAAAPARTFSLGSSADDQSYIRQNIDLVPYGRSIGLTLQPLLIIQLDAETDSHSDGDGDAAQVQAHTPFPPASDVPPLKRDWPRIAADVDKHYGYATQWFALSALIVILYVWFQLLRPQLRSGTRPSTRPDPGHP
jgi:surfeit locus 1 family protein